MEVVDLVVGECAAPVVPDCSSRLEAPAEDLCRHCSIRLERDAATVVAERRAAERAALVELLAAIGVIAFDGSIDGVERDRRLRALWPC